MNRFAILGVALAAALAGCNAVGGFGKDLQALGGAMSDSAADVQARAQPSGARTAAEADCRPDAHGRVHGAGCAPPPLNTPPEPAPIIPPE